MSMERRLFDNSKRIQFEKDCGAGRIFKRKEALDRFTYYIRIICLYVFSIYSWKSLVAIFSQ